MNVAALILALSVFLLGETALALGFEQDCELRGGKTIPLLHLCQCKVSRTVIDLNTSELCLEKLLPFAKAKMEQAEDDCKICNGEQIPPKDEVSEKRLCTEPGWYLCDKARNRYARQLREARADFESKVKEAKGSREALSKTIYTEPRKRIAAALFERAKKAITAVLERRLANAKALGIGYSQSTLKTMLARVKAVQLRVAPHKESEQPEFNAHARYYDLDGKLTDIVHIEGLVLLADRNPQALFRTLLHELGHFTDPTEHEMKEYPFRDETACLQRKDSARAKLADPSCFEKLATAVKDSDAETAEKFDAIAERYRENPYAIPAQPETTDRFDLEHGTCQRSQISEAFADWIAAESYFDYARANGLPTDSNTGIVVKPDGKRMIDLNARGALLEPLLDLVSNQCEGYFEAAVASKNHDQHPASHHRVDGILLAHPYAKQLLGCSGPYLSEVRSPFQLSLDSGRAHCGDALYVPNAK